VRTVGGLRRPCNRYTDDANAGAGLVQATDENFYGTAFGGGANNACDSLQNHPSGTLTTLYSFCSESGILCLLLAATAIASPAQDEQHPSR